MNRSLTTFLLATIGLCMPAIAGSPAHGSHAGAAARARHASVRRGRVPRAFLQAPAGGGDNPYAGYSGPGSAVLNATERAKKEPGVTLELAPDAKETATGGPVGGPPGFDGS